MKSILKITILVSMLITNVAFSMDIGKKHIMVPLEGCLFQVSAAAALGEMGASGALSAAWTGGLGALWRSASSKGADQKGLATRLFTLLASMNDETQVNDQFQVLPEVYWRGIKAPHIVHSWLTSNKTCAQFKESVIPFVQAQAGRLEKSSLEILATIVFDPEKNASMLVPNLEASELLNALRQNGHTIHIVDNWNSEAFDALKQKHKSSFELVNGCQHISGDVRQVKSATNCALHDNFFLAHPEISAKNSVFVETEEKHTTPLLGKPYEHILCKDADIKKLRLALQKIGLLGN